MFGFCQSCINDFEIDVLLRCLLALRVFSVPSGNGGDLDVVDVAFALFVD